MSQEENVEEIIDTLTRLQEDSTIPKNLKLKIQNIMSTLKGKDIDISIKINKALHELDEMGDDANLQPYVRTQLLNIVSMLERI